MFNPTHTLYVALFLACLVPTVSNAWFDLDAFEEHMQKQINLMEEGLKQMQQSFHAPKLSKATQIESAVSDEAITLTLENMPAENIEARLNDADNRLTIVTPQDRITISSQKNMLILEIEHSEKTVTKKQDTNSAKDDGKQPEQLYHSRCASSYISQESRLLPAPAQLDKQKLSYDKEKKELVITIPLAKKSNGTLLPIAGLQNEE